MVQMRQAAGRVVGHANALAPVEAVLLAVDAVEEIASLHELIPGQKSSRKHGPGAIRQLFSMGKHLVLLSKRASNG